MNVLNRQIFITTEEKRSPNWRRKKLIVHQKRSFILLIFNHRKFILTSTKTYIWISKGLLLFDQEKCQGILRKYRKYHCIKAKQNSYCTWLNRSRCTTKFLVLIPYPFAFHPFLYSNSSPMSSYQHSILLSHLFSNNNCIDNITLEIHIHTKVKSILEIMHSLISWVEAIHDWIVIMPFLSSLM